MSGARGALSAHAFALLYLACSATAGRAAPPPVPLHPAEMMRRTSAVPTTPVPRHPNFLLVVIDDLGYDLLESTCTPTLDSLSEQGLRLCNYYTNPLCSPTRAALITARYGFRTGIGKVIQPRFTVGLPLDETTIAEALPTHYANSAIGKWQLVPATVQGFLNNPFQQGFNWFQGTSFNLEQGFSGSVGYYDWIKVTNGVESRAYQYATTVTTNDAIRRMRGPRPWFLWVAYHAPHAPYEHPPAELNTCHTGGVTEREIAEEILEALDTELARLLDVARQNDAYVFVVSDNGTAGRLVEPPYDSEHAKGSIYEGGVRVPAWVIGPSVPAAAVDSLVSAVDLMPTILELTHQDAPDGIDGQSFKPYLEGDLTAIREFVYVEEFAPNQDPPIWHPDYWERAVSDGVWKLIRRTGSTAAPDELYFLPADPLEVVNLMPPDTRDAQDAFHRLQGELIRLGVD